MRRLLLLIALMFTWQLHAQFAIMNEESSTVVYDTVSIDNFGGSGTTDWVDSDSDGLADGWTKNGEYSLIDDIVTGNGFVGNAQRLESTYQWDVSHLTTSTFAIDSGAAYKIGLIQRDSIGSPTVAYRVQLLNSSATLSLLALDVYDDYGDNYGNASYVESGEVVINQSSVRLRINLYNAPAGVWCEIDEVTLIKIE